MPRRPRVEVAGGVYHVYNRVASGEPVFANPEEAVEFVERIRAGKKRDGWTVFAWCLLSNHYHLAIRTSDVPLATSLHMLQGLFSRSFNRRWSRSGSLWQSRYHAKLIDEQRYLSQVVLYIHLNPVRAGLAEDPTDYAFSGHREIVKAPRDPLVDVDDTLLCFGEARRQARRTYLAGMRAGCDPEAPTPAAGSRWWDLIPRRDDVLEGSTDQVSPARRSRSRPPRPPAELLAAACNLLSVSLEDLNGPSRSSSIATARRLVVSALHDLWLLSRRDLAAPLGRNPEVISHWLASARALQASNEVYARRLGDLKTHLVARYGDGDQRR